MDGTGKRRRLFRIAGVFSGVVIAGYAVALGVSLGTGADVPLTTWVVPEKDEAPDDEKRVRRKSVVPSAIRRPSGPVYIPPVVPPSNTTPAFPEPTGKPTPKPTPKPTETDVDTDEPGTVTKNPTPTTKPTSPPVSPAPTPAPTVTAEPTAGPSEEGQPTEPPGQEKKTVEE